VTKHQRILWPKRWSPAVLLLVAVVWQCDANELTVAQEPTVSRILFGSCIKQDQPMPILNTIVKREPDLFIFLGDNIYADTTDMNVMRAKYEKLGADAGFTKLLKTCSVLATWDDHDYGANDAGAEYSHRVESQTIFLDFWGDGEESVRRHRPGIYDLTSSRLNQIHPRVTPTDNRDRLTPTTYHQENFGEVVIHWEQADPQIQLRVLDIDNLVQLEETIMLNQLR